MIVRQEAAQHAAVATAEVMMAEAADETAATLTANKDVPYQVIISTIDAIRRSDDGQELFPDINFGVPK